MCVCFLECVWDEDAAGRWSFIEGAWDKADTLYSRAGAPLWWPLWLKLLQPLTCFLFTPNNVARVEFGRWELSGELNGVGGLNNVTRCM